MDRPIVPIRDGDLAIIADGAGFIIGVFNGGEDHVVYGDVERDMSSTSCYVVPKSHVRPEAGSLIGRRFDDRATTLTALKPFFRPVHAAAWARFRATSPEGSAPAGTESGVQRG